MAAVLEDLWTSLRRSRLEVHSLALCLLRQGSRPSDSIILGLRALGEAPEKNDLTSLCFEGYERHRNRLVSYCGLQFIVLRDHPPLAMAIDISGQRLLCWCIVENIAAFVMTDAGASYKQLLDEVFERVTRLRYLAKERREKRVTRPKRRRFSE